MQDEERLLGAGLGDARGARDAPGPDSVDERDGVEHLALARCQPVTRLLAVASFRALARDAGLSEVTVQGKYVRFHPVDLPDSRVVRLNRLHPKSLYKAPVRTMLVPRPLPPGFGAQPPRDEELIAWVRQVIDGVIQPERGGQSGAGGKAGSEETGS